MATSNRTKQLTAQQREVRQQKLDLLRFAMEVYREHAYATPHGDARPIPPTHDQIVAAAKAFQAFVEG